MFKISEFYTKSQFALLQYMMSADEMQLDIFHTVQLETPHDTFIMIWYPFWGTDISLPQGVWGFQIEQPCNEMQHGFTYEWQTSVYMYIQIIIMIQKRESWLNSPVTINYKGWERCNQCGLLCGNTKRWKLANNTLLPLDSTSYCDNALCY